MASVVRLCAAAFFLVDHSATGDAHVLQAMADPCSIRGLPMKSMVLRSLKKAHVIGMFVLAVGNAYYGKAPVLGTHYIGGYEPIKDASGAIIGVYFVGYKK